MPFTAYIPAHFWSVVAAREGSVIKHIMPRSLGILVVALIPAFVNHYEEDVLEGVPWFPYFDIPNQLVTPFGILVGLPAVSVALTALCTRDGCPVMAWPPHVNFVAIIGIDFLARHKAMIDVCGNSVKLVAASGQSVEAKLRTDGA